LTVVLLRAAALVVNLGVLLALPMLLGAPAWSAALFALAGFGLSWLYAVRVPDGPSADPMTVSLARRLAERMELEPPVFVRHVSGWTAGAVRVTGGYGLVVGEEVDPRHREAVLAHELAHVAAGDLFWEPWTDGVARALTPAVRKLPPLLLILFPFFLAGAPLARLTELAADDRARATVSSYPSVIEEVMAVLGSRGTLLYPSLQQRVRRSARRSLRIKE
jgi:Zn-dependent protease with chaperone function